MRMVWQGSYFCMHINHESCEVDSYAVNANPTYAEIFVTICDPNVLWPLSRDHHVHAYIFASLYSTHEVIDFSQLQLLDASPVDYHA